ncbi:MAG: glycosyltransferase family 2 protein [Phycisphaerae bacterium]|nr:glycosyltransferase family 2 protein [Phycisphaerae bacterium]
MRVLLAIPVFNEARYLPEVLARVRRYVSDLLVVDDGSTDATPDQLRRAAPMAVIRHRRNEGYGQSLIDAFGFAQARGYDWVITMDCDAQHEPAHLPEFIAAAHRGCADIISGSRYLAALDGNDDPPPDRRRINSTITWLLNETLSFSLTDAFCGFKAHRVAALRDLTLDVPGYAIPLQFWTQVAAAGLRVRELPVRLIYKDTSRHFGGLLDDPDARLRHYMDVFQREMRRVGRWSAEVETAARSLLAECGSTT